MTSPSDLFQRGVSPPATVESIPDLFRWDGTTTRPVAVPSEIDPTENLQMARVPIAELALPMF